MESVVLTEQDGSTPPDTAVGTRNDRSAALKFSGRLVCLSICGDVVDGLWVQFLLETGNPFLSLERDLVSGLELFGNIGHDVRRVKAGMAYLEPTTPDFLYADRTTRHSRPHEGGWRVTSHLKSVQASGPRLCSGHVVNLIHLVLVQRCPPSRFRQNSSLLHPFYSELRRSRTQTRS